jgi:hypothetical protein
VEAHEDLSRAGVSKLDALDALRLPELPQNRREGFDRHLSP